MPAKGSAKPSQAQKASKPNPGSIAKRGRGRPAGAGTGVAKKGPGGPSRQQFSKEERLQRWIYKILKNVDPEFGLSKKAMTAMNSIILDVYRKISREAANLSRSRGNKSLRAIDIQTATKLRLPGEIQKHALSEAAKALTKYRVSHASN